MPVDECPYAVSLVLFTAHLHMYNKSILQYCTVSRYIKKDDLHERTTNEVPFNRKGLCDVELSPASFPANKVMFFWDFAISLWYLKFIHYYYYYLLWTMALSIFASLDARLSAKPDSFPCRGASNKYNSPLCSLLDTPLCSLGASLSACFKYTFQHAGAHHRSGKGEIRINKT